MIDPAMVKLHLRVDTAEEDELILGYTEAALSAFETWTNRTLLAPDADLPEPLGNALRLSKSITQGVLLLVGHWYANRESAVTGITATALPLATTALWSPHRWVKL
ncbi:head-tail connector protein [Pseudomonas iridis]|uniref:head-tail connector protein n=1 Tax=Pseudomonas iridis TaxID=2710587 RepID=UPI001B340E3D|nr:head-tail connector protein [Pseudomonas iridis]MBP5971066.1 phage gp6-like head-tail connector protein [Pseudomonas iridis]